MLARLGQSVAARLAGTRPSFWPAGGIAALSVLLGGGVVLLASADGLFVAWLFAIGTIAVAVGAVAWRSARSEFDLFEPIVPSVLMLGTLFGLRPLVMMATGNFAYGDGYYIGVYFPSAVVVGFIGTLSFTLAYFACAGWSRPTTQLASSLDYNRTAYRNFAIGCIILGITLFGLHLSLNGSITESIRTILAGRSAQVSALNMGSSEYLTSAPILVGCAGIVLVALRRGALDRRSTLLVVVLAAYPVLVFLAFGNRRFVIPAIALPILVGYFLRGRRPRLRTVGLLLPLAFIAFATIPFARSQGAREQAGGAVNIYAEAFSRPAEVGERFLTGPDTAMVAVLAVEIETLRRTGEYAFGGATIGDFLLAPIPSALFPSKPETWRDDLLTDAFNRPCEVRPGGGCPDFSLVGTFYQDLGYPGVAVGMSLFAAAAAGAWRRFRGTENDPVAAVVLAAVTVFWPVIIRAGFLPAIVWFLYFVLPSVFGIRLAAGRVRSSAGAALPLPGGVIASSSNASG